MILVAFDPASPSTVFVLTHSSQYSFRLIPTRLLRSDDGGATWTDLSEGSPPLGGWPQDIWFDSTSSPSAVYAIGWRSTDRGESWTELSPEEADRTWVQHSKEPETDFQGTVTDANTGGELTVLVGRVDPSDPSIRYAGTEVGVYSRWTAARAGIRPARWSGGSFLIQVRRPPSTRPHQGASSSPTWNDVEPHFGRSRFRGHIALLPVHAICLDFGRAVPYR